MPMDTPVLLNVFNRPEATQGAVDALRTIRPKTLYVAADGPRSHVCSDAQNCQRVRDIVASIDWPCDLHTLFREQNLGCKYAIEQAISWFLQHAESGIILEDDVRVDPSFYPFCTEMLHRYRDEQRVGIVSGCNFAANRVAVLDSYCFTRNLHMWGWATWRRAWQHVDVDMSDWNESPHADFIQLRYGASWAVRIHWEKIFDNMANRHPTTWDFQVCYALWKRGMLSITPARNLVGNVGFGADATHAAGSVPAYINANAMQALTFPLRHPESIVVNHEIDMCLDQDVYGISFTRSMRRFAQMAARRLQSRLLRAG